MTRSAVHLTGFISSIAWGAALSALAPPSLRARPWRWWLVALLPPMMLTLALSAQGK